MAESRTAYRPQSHPSPHRHLQTGVGGPLGDGGPQALAKTKAYLQQFSRQALSIEDAAKASAAPRLTEECQEGLRAFFAKQAAPWVK